MPVIFIPHPAACHQTSTSMLCMLQALGPSLLCSGCTPAVTSFLSRHPSQLRKLLLEIPRTDLPESMLMIVNDMEGGKVLTRPPADNAPCRVFTMAGRVLRKLSPSKSMICTCRAAGLSLSASLTAHTGGSAWDERGSPLTAPPCWPQYIPGELKLPLDDILMQGLENGALPSLSISKQCPMGVEEA